MKRTPATGKTSKCSEPKSVLTLFSCPAYSPSSQSGGGFNPAVSSGLIIAKCIGGSYDGDDGACSSLRYLWLYWLAPLLGSVLASGMFMVVHAMEAEESHIYEDELHKEMVDQANAMEVNPVRASTYGF